MYKVHHLTEQQQTKAKSKNGMLDLIQIN